MYSYTELRCWANNSVRHGYILNDQSCAFLTQQLTWLIEAVKIILYGQERNLKRVLKCFECMFNRQIQKDYAPSLVINHLKVFRKFSAQCKTWPRGYKTFFKLSSAEHEISTASKC